MTEYLVLVDGNDCRTGTGEKVACHLPQGRLHRAFTALIFDTSGRLVLARRSPSKMLWPNVWDGTFASHPRNEESYLASATRRMAEEMGTTCSLDYLFKFEYHVPYEDVGSENEMCGVVMGVAGPDVQFRVSADEISELNYILPDELLLQVRGDPHSYCPWMLAALYLLPESEGYALQKYAGVLSSWMEPALRAQLADSIRAHMPDGNWRLVS